jgi:5'-AMP-activated protein kinase regulatory beta subunit
MPKVRFAVDCPGAKKVCLAGNFNGWDTEAQRMKRQKKGEDTFLALVDLEPGCYQFKYVVDGEWRCAPDAPCARDDAGNENSLLEVC